MTKEQLEDYRSKKAEISELRYRLAYLGEGDSLVGNSVIMDYSTGYPRPQSVIGYDFSKEARLKARYLSQISRIQKECEAVEEWIDGIPDSLTRRIFRMYYIDGLRQRKIAQRVHISQAAVSKRISEYLQME